ncbi:MAG: hypothetical protein V1874_07380 [Spirochaetota bacterium]
MRINLTKLIISILAAILLGSFFACGGGDDDGGTGGVTNINVTFLSATQTGGTSGTADSTGLVLEFDADPATMTADNIGLTGAVKEGILSGSGTMRSLAISNIGVANGATVTVTITSPDGYTITGSPQTAVIYRAPVNVTFLSATQTGGTSGTAESTGLTLAFDADPATLTADNITVNGAAKGALTGTGTTRSLAISDINVTNEGTVMITITSPSGYSITGTPKTALVYRFTAANMTIGMDYRGGKLAYILQAGDPGYDVNVPHGLIAAATDQSGGINWALAAYQSTSVPGGTGWTLGTGSANTNNIIAQNGEGSAYAAGLARAYNGGGYSDWYLPSADELNMLYLNRGLIGGFNSSYYWSSSEYFADGARIQYFGDGTQLGGNKNNYWQVRAARSF